MIKIPRVFKRLKVILYGFILQLLILFSTSYTQSGDYKFTHLTTDDGLSLNVVTKIIQDQRGFMWFGTYNGLNRFDGYNFKIFLPNPGNPKSISNHSIWALHQDAQGFIWVGTLDGLNKYNPQTEEFTKYFPNPNKPNSISNNYIYSVYEDREGTIWIGTLNGLNKYNRDKDNFTVIKKVSNHLNPDSLNSVICIEEDFKGNLWLGTWNGVTCISKNGRIIKQYLTDSLDSKTFDYRKISTLFEDKQHNMWIGLNGHGLKKYNPNTGKFTSYKFSTHDKHSLSNNYVTVIFQDKSNKIWVGTKNGLNVFNPDQDNFDWILHNPLVSQSLINNDIYSIQEDKSGLIWIGTSEGLSRFFLSLNNFYYYDEFSKDPSQKIISNRIYAADIDRKGNIWIGTFDGLDEIKNNGTIIHHRNVPNNSNSLSNNLISSVLEDRDGYIWIGTNHSGLNRYDPSTKEYKLYTYDANDSTTISNNGVISIYEDRKGTLWFGTWWGLNYLDKNTGKFHRYFSSASNPNTFKNDIIWDICEDSDGMMWLGTDGGGASRFNPETEVFSNYSLDSNGVHHISSNRVFTIFESSNKVVWMGTTDGLNGYDLKTGKIKIFTKQNGLPGNFIDGIEEDKKGNLWLATNKGLSKFDMKTETFSNFSERDGLKEMEFNQNVAAKSSDGNLYFGCKSGLMYFNPNSIINDKYYAPIVITDFKIFNQSVPILPSQSSILNRSITETNSIKIPYEKDIITFDFALLDFFNAKRNKFEYTLAGFDKGWNDVGVRNSATYTNLPPGEYKIIIKAYNSAGLMASHPVELSVSIIPAFYQTWLFRIAVLVLVFLMTIFVSQYRTIKIKHQNKILESRVAERTKDLDSTINVLSEEIVVRKKAEENVQKSLEEKEVLLKEIHHRVKNNLQVISSLLYLQSISIKDDELRELFDDSQNRIKSMALIHEKLYQSKNLNDIDFYEYVNGLMDHLNKTYENPGHTIQTKINIENIKLSLDTAISCGLIVNELITNAFKYAFPADFKNKNNHEGKPTIEINLDEKEKNKYLLTVHDNGVGIPEKLDIENAETLGLKLVNSMTSQLNGTINIERENGTKFSIEFIDII